MGDKKYLNFEPEETKRKTKVWTIKNRVTEEYIGRIQWYSNWRQYCFEPFDSTVFAKGCLNEIVIFISIEMDKRRRS